jgi:DNA repair photolyase
LHYKEVKGILSQQNGMNIYRGCSHGCIYCDTRSKCYSFEHDIEDIEIKTNAAILLEKKLSSKRQKCMIGTGAMNDPYIPLEKKIGNTRKCLEIIYKYGFGLSILTKSNRILRDLDLLKRINEKSKCVVEMTLTTYDENLCKILEPNVSTTKERFEVLKEMHENNIPTVVWLSPILPFINDTKENLIGILNYCIEARVYGILCFNMGLTLREGNREYFYQKLDEHFPGLKKMYQKRYGNRYEIVSDNNAELMKIFYDVCKKNNIECDTKKIFEYLRDFPEKTKQLTLFD